MSRLEKEFVINSKQGLHARPAALFVQMTEKYDSEITIIKDGEEVNGKSIMGLLMLGAHYQSKVRVIADGQDAPQAMASIETFFNTDTEHP